MMCPSLDIKTLKHSICTICPKARQPRLAFYSSSIKTTVAFQLIHIDVWGPYSMKTYNSCSYFLTIVDDFTRMDFLIQYKSESVSHIRHFLDYVTTQFHTKVQIIRSENAKELSEGSILQLYHDRGIIHQKSCVATPQQNGVVERKHKHLLETARALYFQSHVPLQFWGDYVLTACYLINRMPLFVLNFISPFEKLYGYVRTQQ